MAEILQNLQSKVNDCASLRKFQEKGKATRGRDRGLSMH